MDAAEVMQAMAKRYAECRTYSDSGVVAFEGMKGEPLELEFRTRFIRAPQYFSFEWQDYGPSRGLWDQFCLLWSKDGETITRYRWGTEKKESLMLAIAGATGCSAGAAQVISALLLEEIRSKSHALLELGELELVVDDEIEENCFIVKGSSSVHGVSTLWTRKSDCGLIRVVEDYVLTAEDARRRHGDLLSDAEAMQRFAARGISVPKELSYKDSRSKKEYRYYDVCFDGPVEIMEAPVVAS